MTDKTYLAAMRILSNITTLAYQADPDLYPLVPLKQVSLSVQYGNSPQSAFGYVGYGIILCGLVEDIESGYRFGQLAINLLSQFNTKEVTSKVMNGFNCLVRHWQEHTQETVQALWEGYTIGLETGDLEFAGINIRYYNTHLYFLGRELHILAKEMRTHTQALQQIKQERIAHHNEIQRQRTLNLLGEVDDVLCLKGEAYDEEVMLPISIENNDMFALLEFYFTKFQLSYLFGKYQLAQGYAAQLEQYASGGLSMVISRQCNFYTSLARLGIYLEVNQDTQAQILNQVINNQEKMHLWANHCPMNILHQYYLVEAEKYRVLGNKSEAIEYYDRAIALAKENGYIQEEALANELAAKFYLDWGKEKVAASYMQEAYYCYARWGAKAKTDDLEQRYPHLLRPILQPITQRSLDPLETLASISDVSIYNSTKTSRSSSTNINTILDFTAIFKASQSLSSTIQLHELIHQLTQILLQHSGGDGCALIMPNQACEWHFVAIATLNTVELCTEPLEGNNHLPVKLIQYVKNIKEVVVIDDLKTDLPVIDDYLIQQQPKSVLCLPILNQGQLIAILYLKNRTTSGVFTSDRIMILNFLCTQAAISLENARLYQQAQTYAQQLEQSQLQIVQSEKMASLGNLVAGVAHEINNPIGFLNGSINNGEDYVQDLLAHLALYQQHYPNPVTPIQDHAQEIDLEFLIEDLPKLLDSMKGAADRMKGISTSLRTFSRADTEHKVSANLHDGIDSTLLILKYRLKANEFRPAIKVIQEYGQLALVECFPGQLNQVFMNILANAIDMFDEMAKTQSPQEIAANSQQITIHTAMIEPDVQIRIRDNGKGMTEDVKARIFDHLFTTKGVGKGTGLGLAIARQIVVEKHGGSLEVQSEVGRGTEFLIQLPIRCYIMSG